MNLEECFASVEAALVDSHATLFLDLGGEREITQVRLWRGQVLVDWEPDAEVGDCLLRPALLRRLVALDARVTLGVGALTLQATGRILTALSARHAALVQRLGGARRVDLAVRLRFDPRTQSFLGGDETYTLIERGRPSPLMRLQADVSVRAPRAASPHMSPLPT